MLALVFSVGVGVFVISVDGSVSVRTCVSVSVRASVNASVSS